MSKREYKQLTDSDIIDDNYYFYIFNVFNN